MDRPTHYRPDDQIDVDGDGKTVEDWEDNRLSNSLAWASANFVPAWCQTEEHWTSRFANTLFTTCPCCMIFRGVTVGFVIATIWWLPLVIFGVLWLLGNAS